MSFTCLYLANVFEMFIIRVDSYRNKNEIAIVYFILYKRATARFLKYDPLLLFLSLFLRAYLMRTHTVWVKTRAMFMVQLDYSRNAKDMIKQVCQCWSFGFRQKLLHTWTNEKHESPTTFNDLLFWVSSVLWCARGRWFLNFCKSIPIFICTTHDAVSHSHKYLNCITCCTKLKHLVSVLHVVQSYNIWSVYYMLYKVITSGECITCCTKL